MNLSKKNKEQLGNQKTKPKWEKRFLHERDYRDLTVKLGFRTPPKAPDPAYGELVSAGPIRVWKGKLFWEEFAKLGHTHIDPDLCSCMKKKD